MQNNSLKKLYTEIYLPTINDLVYKFPQIILLYFFILQPPFISRTSYFLLELFIFLIFIIIKSNLFFNIVAKFKSESFLFFLIILFTLIRDGFKGEEVFIFRFVSWSFQCFFFSILIVTLVKSKTPVDQPSLNIFSLSFWVFNLAALSSIILLLNPHLNDLYKSFIVIDPYDINQIESYRIRAFGIGESLTFTYSYLLGFTAGYIIYILNQKVLYSICLPFLILGVIFNARIGFLPIILFLILTLFKKGSIKNLLIILMVTISLILIIPQLPIFNYLRQNSDWVTSIFYDIGNVFMGKKAEGQGTLNVLLHDAIIIPSDFWSLIFGEGINLFFSPPGRANSDIGFINQLNYGGITFLTLLLGLFIFMIIRLSKKMGSRFWFVFIFTASIIILNYKGSAFASTPGSRFLYLMYIYLIDLSTPDYKNSPKSISI